MGPVAQAVFQGVDDQVLLHLGDGLSDEGARCGLCRAGRSVGRARTGVRLAQGLTIR